MEQPYFSVWMLIVCIIGLLRPLLNQWEDTYKSGTGWDIFWFVVYMIATPLFIYNFVMLYITVNNIQLP